MSITRDNDFYKVTSKHLNLIIKQNEYVVTSYLGNFTRLPLVILRDKKVWKPKHLQYVDNHIVIKDENGEIVIYSPNNNEINFQISSNSTITIMWPASNTECYFADNMLPANKSFTSKCVYKITSSDPTEIQLSIPILRQEKNNGYLCSEFNGDSAEFCLFHHETEQYFNITSEKELKLSFNSFSSRSESLDKMYKKYPKIHSTFRANNGLTVQQMQEILYFNWSLTEESDTLSGIFIEQVKEIQHALEDNYVFNCVIGSLAMRLNGFNCPVGDVDIAVHSIEKAKKILKLFNYTFKVSCFEKWKNCGVRILNHCPQIDIAEVHIPHSDCFDFGGMKVLNKQGLLKMKLIGEFERTQMEPNYQQLKNKNMHNIGMLLGYSSYIYPFFDDFLKCYSLENFENLLNTMNGASWDSLLVNVNFPLIANVFRKEDTFFIPIINTGSPCKAKITFGTKVKLIDWKTFGKEKINNQDYNMPSQSYDLSVITIPEVSYMGILICKEK